MNNQETILKQAGLSEEQAIMYETLLKNGPQKAGFLISWTGIKRGLAYKVLEQLEHMGLVEKKDSSGTVAVFHPNHPSRLLEKMDRDQKNIELAKEMVSSGLGTFISEYNLLGGKPNVRFFEGVEGVAKITGDFPKVEKEIKQIIDISSALHEFKDKTLEYLNKRVALGIHKKMLLPKTKENLEYVQQGSPLTEFRFLPEGLVMPTSFQLYEEKVTILTLKENKKIGIIIEDHDIYRGMQSIFDALWILSNPPVSLEKE